MGGIQAKRPHLAKNKVLFSTITRPYTYLGMLLQNV